MQKHVIIYFFQIYVKFKMPAKVNPKRQRNSIFFYVSNLLGTHELNVAYKNTKVDIQPLSASYSGAPIKRPFGPPSACEYRVKNTDEHVFKFTNARKQSVEIKDSLLNNLQFGVDDFSRKITSLTTSGQNKLLAHYISLINKSEGFIHHRNGLHDPNGFLISEGDDESPSSPHQHIVDIGGSIEDLKEFVAMAKESALEVPGPKEALEMVRSKVKSSRKRNLGRSGEVTAKKPKLARAAAIQENEKKELEDVEGLEKKFQDSFCGVAHLPLDNISVPPQMELKKNPFRVEYIKLSIKKRYNPALSVLVVAPVDDTKKMDTKKDKFYVIQKVKVLQAFKLLDKDGDFEDLYGHGDRQVLCYILNSNNSEVMQYANLSENYVTGQFASRTVPQDILHQFHCLTLRDCSVNSVKVVQRMSKLCCLRSEDSTALDRICTWSKEGFSCFMTVLQKFEQYSTTDVKNASGMSERVSRGEKLNLTNVLLRMLGKCSEKYFVDNSDDVVKKIISMRELAENYQEFLELDKVLKVLSKIAQFVPVETIRSLHPGKFEDKKMKNFIGAMFNDKVKNEKAVELEKYYEFVITAIPGEDYSKPVELTYYDKVSDISEDQEALDAYDLIIYNMTSSDSISVIVNNILGSDNSSQAALLLFPSELDHFKVLSFLRNQDGVTKTMKNFQIVPLLFNVALTRSSSHCKVVENIKYGLLFGRFTQVKFPLLVHYCDVTQLNKVLESICQPSQSVCFISDPGVEIIKVHNQDLEWKVMYYGSKTELEKFKKVLSKDKKHVEKKEGKDQVEEEIENELEKSKVCDVVSKEVPEESIDKEKSRGCDVVSKEVLEESIEVCDEDSASTSNTPAKMSIKRGSPSSTSPAGLNDSGFMECNTQSLKSVRKSLSFNSKMDLISEGIN